MTDAEVFAALDVWLAANPTRQITLLQSEGRITVCLMSQSGGDYRAVHGYDKPLPVGASMGDPNCVVVPEGRPSRASVLAAALRQWGVRYPEPELPVAAAA